MAAPQRRKSEPRGQHPPPAQKFRAGRLEATVWEQQGDQGVWYSVTFRRNYKDAQGNWQSSESFGLDDLLGLGELARLAWNWILDKRSERRPTTNGDAHEGY